MKQLNFTNLMREVNAMSDPNAKELRLCEARACYEQTFLSAGNAYLMQVESAIALAQKERELSGACLPPSDEGHSKSHKLKISVCLVLELLNLLGKGRCVNDLTTLSRLASIITGFSKESILNTVQSGIVFSERHHGADILKVNAILQVLGVPFLIDISKRY